MQPQPPPVEGPAQASREAQPPEEPAGTDTANAESWRSDVAPQAGQGTGASSSRRWRRSKVRSQAGHWYSKMGIYRPRLHDGPENSRSRVQREDPA